MMVFTKTKTREWLSESSGEACRRGCASKSMFLKVVEKMRKRICGRRARVSKRDRRSTNSKTLTEVIVRTQTQSQSSFPPTGEPDQAYDATSASKV